MSSKSLEPNYISYDKFKIVFNHSHDLPGIVETHVIDVYESELIAKNSLVIDFGAGIGDFSILAGRIAGPGGKIVAIEPSTVDFETLLFNIHTNSLENIIAVNAAVGKPGKLHIEFKGRSIDIQQRDVHEILNEHHVDWSAYESIFLKIDIEGAEVDLLRGLMDILEKTESIAIELHGTRKIIDDLLLPMGFNFHRIGRKRYLWKAAMFAIKNPISSLRILKQLKNAGEFPGMKKITNGIEIASSDNLVVGVYKRKAGYSR